MFSLDVQDWDSKIVFNTYIRDNKNSVMIIEWSFIDVLKFVSMSDSCIDIFEIS